MMPRKQPPPPESWEQCRVAAWLDAHGILWCHVPNGQLRTKRGAAQLKREGVKSGVPDILIFEPPTESRGSVGTAVELKRTRGGRVSDSQNLWVEKLRGNRWCAFIACGHREAIDRLIALGYGAPKD